VLCQSGDHEKLLCGLHRARLKGVSFYQSRPPAVKPKDAVATRGTRSTFGFKEMRKRPAAALEFELANFESRGAKIDEEAMLLT
jgi:hypothetical protein